MPTIRAAVVQAGSAMFDRERSLEKALSLMAGAAEAGAELVVFPEAFIAGYPKGLDFGARVGSRTPEGHAMYRRYHASAVDVPGPLTDALGEACRQHGQHLVMGVIERDGGTLYCTALFFDAAGTPLGKHRKVMPTAMERLVWGYGDGSTLPVFDTAAGKIGAVICWENYMPLLRMAMYAKGIQFYCAPTVDDRERWTASMRHIALEGRCFVLSAVQFLRRDDCPRDYAAFEDAPPETVLISGGSVIINPKGEILAGPARGGEAILTADLDLDELIEAKYDFDVVGHYARPDLFRLTVNEAAARPVVIEG